MLISKNSPESFASRFLKFAWHKCTAPENYVRTHLIGQLSSARICSGDCRCAVNAENQDESIVNCRQIWFKGRAKETTLFLDETENASACKLLVFREFPTEIMQILL